VQILDALHKVGVHPRVVLLPAGYGQATLKQLGASANGLSFSTDFVPFQASNDKAHRQAKAAFKKYAPGTAISDTLVDGYLSAQMLIKGLKLAGADCPSQKAFIHKLRNVTSYTAGGFFDPPINLKTTFGKPYGLCFHFTEVRHQKFVPLNHGDATCGKVVK
jgi:ABC-type branched-subunit amino acid transport system substrate-binding protein